MKTIKELIDTHDPKPPKITVLMAITNGHLSARKSGNIYIVKEEDYLEWLSGWPHKPGAKRRKR